MEFAVAVYDDSLLHSCRSPRLSHAEPTNIVGGVHLILSFLMLSQPPPEAKSVAKFPDGITDLEYLKGSSSSDSGSSTNNHHQHHVAATSWDGTLRVFDTATGTALLTQTMESGPLLSLTIASPTCIVTGGLDGSVKCFDPTSTTVSLIGRQEAASSDESSSSAPNAVSCLVALNETIVASASWNSQFCLWNVETRTRLATLELPGKAFGMDVDGPHQRVLVATSGRRIVVIDCSDSSKPQIVVDRESSLKFQTRCIAVFPNTGLALGSVEGRVGVEYLEELGQPGKKYAFKCHRVGDTVYPVNCIRFHPRITDTFATGGCDGSVVLWDGGNKKKLTTLPSFPTSISALAFNHDGSEIAIASSYTFEDGDREHPQDELFVRAILESECLPKPKE